MDRTDIARAVQELDDEVKLEIIRALLEVEGDDWDQWQGDDWRHGGEENILVRITVPDWWDWREG